MLGIHLSSCLGVVACLLMAQVLGVVKGHAAESQSHNHEGDGHGHHDHHHHHGNAANPIFPLDARPELTHVPTGALHDRLAELPAVAQERALAKLAEVRIGAHDLPHLRVDDSGGVFYVCDEALSAEEVPAVEVAEGPVTAAANTMWESGFTPSGSVALTSPPVFNSKPGATNVVYLDFNGDTVSGTAWNSGSWGDPIHARAYNLDYLGYNSSVFEAEEQRRIYQIWQRMAEDLAPFDINVTTDPYYDDAGNRGPTIGQVLFTHSSDPGAGGGGIAYVGVFGASNYSNYQPAWVFYDKLGSGAAQYMAEAGSHEFGHNIGLGHDGTSSVSYYSGHGSGNTSWGPIMGVAYGRNVSQWSNGEYYDANQTQDDQAFLIAELGYRADDHGNTIAASSSLAVSSGATIDSSDGSNQGIISSASDVDVFGFSTGAGTISLRVDPFVVGAETNGGNLDIGLRLFNASGSVIASSDPSSTTWASMTTSVSEGNYYLEVRGVGVGDPASSSPTGYVDRHSTGQFFVSGTVLSLVGDVEGPSATLTATNVLNSGGSTHAFSVTYSDVTAVDVSSLSSGDLQVTGPNSYSELVTFSSVNINSDGWPRTATYQVPAPGGVWDIGDNGTYTVAIRASEVTDTEGNFSPAQTLGTFAVSIIPPPEITSALTATGQVALSFQYSITASNSPTSYGASALPSGLSINTSTGVISGTPAVDGAHNVSISATNSEGTDTETLILTIAEADITAPASTSTALIVSGEVSTDTVSLSVNGTFITVDESGAYRAVVTLADGSNIITIVATDASGNSSSRVIQATSAAMIPAVGN